MATRPRPPKSNRRAPAPLFPGGFLMMSLVMMAVLSVPLYYFYFASVTAIRYDQFEELLAAGKLKKVTMIGNDRITAELTDAAKIDEEVKKLDIKSGKLTVRLLPASDRRDLYERIKNRVGEFDVVEEQGGWLASPLAVAAFTAAFIMLLLILLLPRMRDSFGGGVPSQFNKSPARKYDRNSKQRVTFDDVAALEGAKRELYEIVEFLRSPDKFLKLGAQIPKGVLLVGPPGTGKTLLARAIAGEANATFFSINGAEFIQLYVGVGASRVRDLFRNAKESAPCLIFIDEIDAVGRMRGAGVGGGSDEREQTLNQILGEMDGFSPTDTVIVLAATNRPDVLDSALLRPGRFDRTVTVDRPTWQGRLAILKLHAATKPLADDVDLEALAKSTIGMTGADLRNLANEAAILAARNNKGRIDRIDFEHALDRIRIGPRREDVSNVSDKRRVAYHEAGHALVAMHEPEAEKPHKVTIVPHGQALGVNLFVPDEEKHDHGLKYFKSKIAVFMGGRAADRLAFGEIYAGQENDLKQASRLARYMVTHWGMSERIGPVSFRVGEEHIFLGKELQEPRDFSEGTAKLIDEEVQRLVTEAEQRASDLVTRHRDQLDQIVEALLKHEEIDLPILQSIVGVTSSPGG